METACCVTPSTAGATVLCSLPEGLTMNLDKYEYGNALFRSPLYFFQSSKEYNASQLNISFGTWTKLFVQGVLQKVISRSCEKNIAYCKPLVKPPLDIY